MKSFCNVLKDKMSPEFPLLEPTNITKILSCERNFWWKTIHRWHLSEKIFRKYNFIYTENLYFLHESYIVYFCSKCFYELNFVKFKRELEGRISTLPHLLGYTRAYYCCQKHYKILAEFGIWVEKELMNYRGIQ